MNDLDISPDDPRLTAYALGELAGDERAAIEAALRRSSELRAAMEEIRATTAQIESALAAEAAEAELLDPPVPMPMETLAPRSRRAGSGLAEGVHGREERATHRAPARLISFPRWLVVSSGLAAACVAGLLLVRDRPASSVPAAAHVMTARAEQKTESAAPARPETESVIEKSSAIATLPPVTTPSAEAIAPFSPTASILPEATHPTLTEAASARTEAVAATSIETPPPTTERADDTLALLNQVRHEQSEPALQAPEVRPMIHFDPLGVSTGPLVPQLALTPPPVGLPTTAREPQLPVRVEPAREEPNSRGQAMLRPENDAVRIANLRGASSEAERARLLAEARRGEARGRDSARERGPTATGEARGGFWTRIAGKNRRDTNPAAQEARERPAARASRGEAIPRERENNFVAVAQHPSSSFPLAVGAIGYAELQRAIQKGALPGSETVRIEELVNHFSYRLNEPAPTGSRAEVGSAPPAFASTLEVAAAPWAADRRLVRIALKGRTVGGKGSAIIAKDAAIRVDFNPARVAHYRLIGFEGAPREADGAAHPKTAGEIEAGYAVTALYEIVPAPSAPALPGANGNARAAADDVLSVALRYVEPANAEQKVLEFSLGDTGASFADASADFKFAAAVAGFGMILRDSPHKGNATWERVIEWAGLGLAGVETKSQAERNEFIALAQKVQALGR